MLEDNDIDITGWDLRKALRLMQKSNAPLIERLQSPIVYLENEAVHAELLELAQQFYSRIATVHHYLSMCKKCYEDVAGKDEYKLKKFFYALRTAVACQWICERDLLPPIEFVKMLDGLDFDAGLRQRIDELIVLKSTQNEAYLHQGEAALIEYIEQRIAATEEVAQTLPPAHGNSEALDTFFRKTLRV